MYVKIMKIRNCIHFFNLVLAPSDIQNSYQCAALNTIRKSGLLDVMLNDYDTLITPL